MRVFWNPHDYDDAVLLTSQFDACHTFGNLKHALCAKLFAKTVRHASSMMHRMVDTQKNNKMFFYSLLQQTSFTFIQGIIHNTRGFSGYRHV